LNIPPKNSLNPITLLVLVVPDQMPKPPCLLPLPRPDAPIPIPNLEPPLEEGYNLYGGTYGGVLDGGEYGGV
jgi:hypothetical protein